MLLSYLRYDLDKQNQWNCLWNPQINENIIHLDVCQIMYEYKSNCKKYK